MFTSSSLTNHLIRGVAAAALIVSARGAICPGG